MHVRRLAWLEFSTNSNSSGFKFAEMEISTHCFLRFPRLVVLIAVR